MVSEQEIQQMSSRLEQLEWQVKVLYQHLNLEMAPKLNPEEDPRITDLLRRGKMIEAISLYRQLTNASLVGAKNAMEEAKKKLGV